MQSTSYLGMRLESAEVDQPYFRPAEHEATANYLAEFGYVVVRGLADAGDCDAVHSAFQREVKPYRGFLYRQPTGKPERHVVDRHGHVINSLLYLQALDPRRFSEFLACAWAMSCGPQMQDLIRGLFGGGGLILQTSYFEGNPVTLPHQDGYYMDKRIEARGIATWIALEDIEVGAGRLWVCPGSHRLPPYDPGAETYGSYLERGMTESICRAPALAKGDVLLWFSTTIHGSLPTTRSESSRRSLVTHFVPDGAHISPVVPHRVRYGDVFRDRDFMTINGTRIHSPVGSVRARNHYPAMTKAVLGDIRSRVGQCVRPRRSQ